MEQFDPDLLKKLYIPPKGSHKGQNGKLMVIGGSHLFHSASLWSLSIASRVVDMVFYSSVPENNKIVQKIKEEFIDGIIVPRDQIEEYIDESDCILIGPGMVRTESRIQNSELRIKDLHEINMLDDEGEQTFFLTRYLLEKYPDKKWVIDAGALQMLEAEWLTQLNGNVIITPHLVEFERVFHKNADRETVSEMAKKFSCIILLKGEKDIVCSAENCMEITGGNAGMTKGGTGDVLAGFVAALACKNELFLAAASGSYFNKKAGESLYERVGYYFNASDLVQEIPKVMNRELMHS